VSEDPFGISFLTSARRRLSTIALIARTVRRSGTTAPELLAAARREARNAAADPRLSVIIPGLWRVEAVTVGAGRHPLDAMPLITHPPPGPAQPIAHGGWATGVCQRLGFEADVLRLELDRTTHERYRGFCWDGIGADLLVHARPSVRLPARALGMIGGGAKPPDRSGCFARFRSGLSAEEDRLVAHGLGRMVLVTQAHLRSALNEAARLPPEWRPHAIQGIAFAFAMVNYADAPMILERSRDLAAAVAPAFHDGLVYALVFSEWLGPGLLAPWQPRTPFEGELVARARRESELNLERGYPLPFALSDPSASADSR